LWIQVTGASCLEIYKLLQKKPVESYSNTFTNLAVSLFTSMEPQPPTTHTSVVKGKEWKWTQWDRIDISQPDMTLKGLMGYLEEEYGAELSMLSQVAAYQPFICAPSSETATSPCPFPCVLLNLFVFVSFRECLSFIRAL
jgi:hypothetical protein